MNPTPASSSASPDPTIPWLCQQIKQELPAILPTEETLPALEKRIEPLFLRTFPRTSWNPEKLKHCYQSRAYLVTLLGDRLASLSDRNGNLDLPAIIKSSLAKSPNLSTGNSASSLSLNRNVFCEKLTQAALWLDGSSFSLDTVEQDVESIQQHVVWGRSKENSPQRGNEFLEQYLQLYYLTDPDARCSADQCQVLLNEQCYDFQKAVMATSYANLELALKYKIAKIAKINGDELWTSLIGHERVVTELLMRCNKNTATERLECVELLLNIGMEVERNLAKETFFRPEPNSFCNEFLSHMRTAGFTDPQIYEIYERLPPETEERTMTLYAQLAFFAAFNSEFRETHLRLPPAVDEFVDLWLAKDYVEWPEVDFDDRLSAAEIYMEKFFSGATKSKLFTEEDNPAFLRQIELFSRQNDLFLCDLFQNKKTRVNQKASINESFPLFPLGSCLYEVVKNAFCSSWNRNIKHPLLSQVSLLRICEETLLEEYPQLEPCRQPLKTWIENYFKFIWYTHPQFEEMKNSPRRNYPTLYLFLEWHAAKLLLSFPDLNSQQLIRSLKEVANEKIPPIPVDDLDISSAIRPLFCALKKNGFVPLYVRERERICSQQSVSEQKE